MNPPKQGGEELSVSGARERQSPDWRFSRTSIGRLAFPGFNCHRLFQGRLDIFRRRAATNAPSDSGRSYSPRARLRRVTTLMSPLPAESACADSTLLNNPVVNLPGTP